MKEKFITNWLLKLKDDYNNDYFTYKMKTKNNTFTLQWKNDKCIQLINSKGGTCNTLPIKKIKELFDSYNGGDIDYPKHGLYHNFAILISSLYEEFTNEEANTLNKEINLLGDIKQNLEMFKELQKLTNTDGTPYFHVEYLAHKFLGLSTEEIKQNKKLWENSK